MLGEKRTISLTVDSPHGSKHKGGLHPPARCGAIKPDPNVAEGALCRQSAREHTVRERSRVLGLQAHSGSHLRQHPARERAPPPSQRLTT